MIKLVLTGFWLLLLSCSHTASGSNTPQGPSSQTICSSDADCQVSGEFCDYLFPKATTGKGKCTHACHDTLTCHDSEVCNPISGFCEITCEGNSNSCNIQGSPNLSFCIGSNAQSYCALAQSSSGGCPALLKPSGGLCKLPCTGSSCSNGQVCDAVTNTCEKGCSASVGTSQCSLTYTPPGAAGPIQLSCSPVTATCVPGCAPPVTCSSVGLRTICDVRLNTCEQPCSVETNSCGNALKCEKFTVGTGEQSICSIACDALGFQSCPGNLYCQGTSASNQICQPPL